MEMIKNRYVRRAKISEYKFRKMIKYFAEDMSATQIALLTTINRNTVNRYLNEIRQRIAEFCETNAPFKEELNSSPPANLASQINTNLGLLKRRGKVYVEMLTNCTQEKLTKLLSKSNQNLTIHAVELKQNDDLVAIGYDHKQSNLNRTSYVSNLDNFWQFVKLRMSKFQGVAKHKSYLHLKESEFRFNFRNDDLYHVMLKLLASKPLN
ncbi:MAG: hypothetical protein RLZZ293_564 [Pseudomonadota bacterium]|jgi:transposase